jgi:hypothetical protein
MRTGGLRLRPEKAWPVRALVRLLAFLDRYADLRARGCGHREAREKAWWHVR